MEEEKAPSGEIAKSAPKTRVLWIVIAVLVLTNVLTLAAGFAGVFSSAPAKPALRIGTLLSLTGGLSPYGPSDTKGAKLAVAEINAAGGVLGQPIQVFSEDDQTNSLAAAAAATKLITQNHVDAIVGAQFSGGSLSSLDTIISNAVPMVSPSATSVKLSDLTVTRGWFFRTISSDALQGAVAGSYLYTNSSFRYAGVLAINNPYGVGLANNFKAKFTSLGGTINGTPVIIPEAQPDYTGALNQLFTAGASTAPQVVYFVGYPDTGLTVMKQWQAGLSTHPWWDRQWVFSEGLDSQDFIDSLRGASVGVDVTKIWGTSPAAPNSTLYNAFVSRYKAQYMNEVPALYASHAYDAVYMIALAAQKAGAVDGVSIRSQLRAVSGPNGTVINGAEWPKALAELAANHTINWEGASGSENLNSTNDPGRGSYEIWSVSAAPNYQIYRVAYFGESLVVPAAAALQLVGQSAQADHVNSFTTQLVAAAPFRLN